MALRLVVAAVLVFGGVLLGSRFAATAQETEFPITPDPSECTVQVQSIDEILVAIGATPVPGGPTWDDDMVMGTPESFDLPQGEPADQETVDAITETLVELMACVNTGNFLYIFEFMTDEMMRTFTEDPISEEEVAFLREEQPTLDPEEYGSLHGLREVTLLPDGRVGALMDSMFPGDEGVQTDYVIFREVDGRWLLDELVEDLEGQYPTVATPMAAILTR